MSAAVVFGTIDLPEISGAVMLGSRLLILADDAGSEDQPFRVIAAVENAFERLRAGGSFTLPKQAFIYKALLKQLFDDDEVDAKAVQDLEDITVSPTGELFLITSHSRNRHDQAKGKRNRLLRMRIDDETGAVKQAGLRKGSDLLNALPVALERATAQRPGATAADGRPTPGFNIEGLAYAPPSDLLLGLRSPTIDGAAVVLRLRDAEQVFDDEGVPLVIEDAGRLDLGGLGIRGMCRDALLDGYWIIAGLSPDPDDGGPVLPNDWSVWFWNGQPAPAASGLMCRFGRGDLDLGTHVNNPEAICIIDDPRRTGARQLLLISDDGAENPSAYALIDGID